MFAEGKRYRTFDYEMKRLYGSKVAKLSIDGGFSCPNRKNGKGCIFCTESGSGEFSGSPEKGSTITEQIEYQKKLMSKWKTDKYIAYFQNYSNTYAPIDELKAKYDEALSAGCFALDIATRPDCLGDDVIGLLKSYSCPLWVELGLQTVSCADKINRGYDNSVFLEAAGKLSAAGIPFVVHIIFGFPWETKEEMLETVRFAVKAGASGIKLHMLYIDRNAPLYFYYKEHPFECLSLEEYSDLVTEALAIIPENVVIHRLTGDGKKDTLEAPEWTKDKRNVLNTIDKLMAAKNYYQGCKIKK